MLRRTIETAFVLSCVLAFAPTVGTGCSPKSKEAKESPAKEGASPGQRSVATSGTHTVDPSLFIDAGLGSPITEVACTLANGEKTTCLSIKRKSVPSDHKQGPWCPTNIKDGPEAGGIWPEGGVAHDVSGAFIKNLATFYKDSKWAVHNADGSINVTKSAEECAAAARPDVDPSMHNHCVQCLPSYLEESVVETLIPKTPRKASAPSDVRSNFGLALNGVEFANSAPTHAILAAHTLAPFDDCGGHINLHEGYHYHAVTGGCLTEIAQPDGHAPMIGYAMDGYAIHTSAAKGEAEPQDLDACRGHSDAERGYHYHVSGPGVNKILGCFAGELVVQPGGRRGPPGGGPGGRRGPKRPGPPAKAP